MTSETHASAARPVYGDQVAVFPVDTNDGTVWMTGRDDLTWQDAFIVWCAPQRLRNLLRHHTGGIAFPDKVDRWSESQRRMVRADMAATSQERPMPVGCLNISYLSRRLPLRLRDWLEARGLHGLTVAVLTGFVDGRHRTAWLMARGAPFIPIMVTSLAECSALEHHAGAGICHVSLGSLDCGRHRY
jgi:hypothetical protein